MNIEIILENSLSKMKSSRIFAVQVLQELKKL